MRGILNVLPMGAVLACLPACAMAQAVSQQAEAAIYGHATTPAADAGQTPKAPPPAVSPRTASSRTSDPFEPRRDESDRQKSRPLVSPAPE
jgi:hypothetical protein